MCVPIQTLFYIRLLILDWQDCMTSGSHVKVAKSSELHGKSSILDFVFLIQFLKCMHGNSVSSLVHVGILHQN